MENSNFDAKAVIDEMEEKHGVEIMKSLDGFSDREIRQLIEKAICDHKEDKEEFDPEEALQKGYKMEPMEYVEYIMSLTEDQKEQMASVILKCKGKKAEEESEEQEKFNPTNPLIQAVQGFSENFSKQNPSYVSHENTKGLSGKEIEILNRGLNLGIEDGINTCMAFIIDLIEEFINKEETVKKHSKFTSVDFISFESSFHRSITLEKFKGQGCGIEEANKDLIQKLQLALVDKLTESFLD